MRPYFSDGNVAIYHGDCREVLPTLAPGGVDLVLTDPPYGVGFARYEAHDDDPNGYIEWLWPVIETAETLVRPTGGVCIFQSAKHMRRWGEWFPRDWFPIALPKTFTQLGREFLPKATDYALFWQFPDAPRRPQDWQPNTARNWFVSRGASAVRTGPERDHPCPRPLDMMSYLVACLCPPRGVVLDPFMGSGTTLVAAKRQGRGAVGIEISEAYCEIAARRLQQMSPSLFDDRKPSPVLRQEALFANKEAT